MKRALVIGLSILIQLIFYFSFLIGLTEHFLIIQLALRIVSLCIVMWIITYSKDIGNQMLWIILILVFPIFGTLLYLTIGGDLHRSKTLRKILKSVEKSQSYLKQDKKIMDEIKNKDIDVYGQLSYISKIAKYPVHRVDEVEYYPLGEDVYKVMLEELKKAEKFIFIEYFIIAKGKMWQGILDILEEKAKNGVDVRVIYDDVGSLSTVPKKYYRKLNEKGIKCLCFNELQPVIAVLMNNRDHRKIMVIDGKVAFSGGINIADEYINEKERFGHWKDNGIMIKGEAVWNFTTTFLEIWNVFSEEKQDYKKYKYNFKKKSKQDSKTESSKELIEKTENDGYICPYAENPLDNENVGENIYINILNQANNYVYIFTPYLILDAEMIGALNLAAKRGVDVRIVVPGIPDKKMIYSCTKSFYPLLLKSGVKIYEYTPGFIHSKVFVCDDKIATVGTLNLDYRSLYHHFECGTYLYNCKVIEEIKKDTIDTIAKSKLVKEANLKTTLPTFLFNGILRLFSALL